MDKQEIRLGIEEVFKEIFPELKNEKFDPNKKQEAFENWDSFSHLTLTSKIEEKFMIDLEVDEVVEVDTPFGFFKLVEEKFNFSDGIEKRDQKEEINDDKDADFNETSVKYKKDENTDINKMSFDSKRIELIDEKNKNIISSKHIFLPSTVIVDNLFSYLKTISSKRCFLVISGTIYDYLKNRLDEIIKIDENNLFIFKGEPTLSIFERYKFALAKSNPDYILAIGGGSVMDLAKSIKQESNLPLILVPTTPATGSETTPYAVLTDTENKKKVIINSKKLLPSVVILDSTLLKTMKRGQLGYSIMDILTHSLEALVSRNSNNLSDVFALESIRLVLENYYRLGLYEKEQEEKESEDEKKEEEKEETEKQALKNILISGFFGGLAQGMASVGLTHALAHYFGPRYDINHGSAVALFIEEVIKLNKTRSDKYQKLNSLKVTSEYDILADIIKVKEFFGLPKEEVRVDANFDQQAAIESIKVDICALTNPVRPSDEELINIFNRCISESGDNRGRESMEGEKKTRR